MTKQNLREREIAIALDQLTGKQSVHAIKEHLKSKGLLPDPGDTLEQAELEFTRKAIQSCRKYKGKDQENRVEFLNFTEISDEGEKIQYYRKMQECTLEESIQWLTYWNQQGRYADKQLRYYFGEFKKIHGRKLQRRLLFTIPKTETAKN